MLISEAGEYHFFTEIEYVGLAQYSYCVRPLTLGGERALDIADELVAGAVMRLQQICILGEVYGVDD